MPHLSPMNWILAAIMFWASLIILVTKSWWTQISFMPFNISKSMKITNSTHKWKWN